MRRALTGLCLAVPLALAGCGTTVPVTSQASSVQQGGGLGLPADTGTGIPTGALEGGAPGSGGRAAPGSGRGAAGQVGGTGSGTGGATQAPAAGPHGSAPALRGRGLTATTVTIGMPVPTGEQAFASSLGISGAGSSITYQDAMRAVLADINASGGVLGRKVQVYFHEFDTAAYIANQAQVTNEICSDFRDDHPVFAVVFPIPTQQLRECLAAMGTPLVGGSGVGGIVPAAAYEHRGGSWFYAPNAITTERLAELFIASLVQRDFHQKWDTAAGEPGGIAPVKLGVIHADTPDAKALYDAYERELKKHGLRYTDRITYAGNLQAGVAATQNAVLKFRSDGITHVYGASAFFLQAAENQGYRPRYAYLPGLGALGVANVPARQMRGALTVGWTPTTDVNQGEDPGDTPAAAACRAVMKGADIRPASRNDEHIVRTVCDLGYAFQVAMRAGGTPSVEGLRRGFESLGTSFRPALTFRAALGPRRHHGVDSVRDMAFDTACGCLEYTSRTDRR